MLKWHASVFTATEILLLSVCTDVLLSAVVRESNCFLCVCPYWEVYSWRVDSSFLRCCLIFIVNFYPTEDCACFNEPWWCASTQLMIWYTHTADWRARDLPCVCLPCECILRRLTCTLILNDPFLLVFTEMSTDITVLLINHYIRLIRNYYRFLM